MKWIIAAPYLKTIGEGVWSLAAENQGIEFVVSPANYQHNRSRQQSSLKDWKDYWLHAADASNKAQQNKCGIITAFPQLAVCTGLQKRVTGKSTPIIASTFNLGALHGSYKRNLARFSLKPINKFIVHSTAEIKIYSHYLNLPTDRFAFIPLHKPLMDITEEENEEHPFLLSMGSANRDYNTLFKAIKKTGLPLVVVAPAHALSGLEIPPSVTIKSHLSLDECRKLVQQARINIIPILNEHTASGQVTLIEAMMYGKPVIATDTIGTRDYVNNGETGILTTSKSVSELENSLEQLWNNASLRETISQHAQKYVEQELSTQRAAIRITRVLNNI